MCYNKFKSTAQHSTAQHSTAQHSTAQHSTAQDSNLKVNKLNNILSSLSFLFILFFVTYSCHSSLSATTANIIHGNAPEITQNFINLLKINFKIDSSSLKSTIVTKNDTHVYTGFDVKFNEIKFDSLTLPNDFFINSLNYVVDSDGDIVETSGVKLIDVSYVWKDKSDQLINNHDQALALASNICDNSNAYAGPYKLIVSGKLEVTSTFGIPRTTDKEFEKTYIVDANDGICYIRPGVLALNKPYGWPEGGNNWPAGSNSVNREPVFNSAVFKERVGFKAWSTQKFPTMAFPEARFRIIPYDENARYQSANDINSNYTKYETFIYSNPNNALLRETSATKPLQVGQYKFEFAAPKQGKDYIVAVKNKLTDVIHYYTFKLKATRSWFYFVYFNEADSDRSGRSYNDAIVKCGIENIPTRSELTNSVYATGNGNPGFYVKNNGYSRDIGSLTAEWGKIYYYAPASTPSDDLKDMMADTFSSYKSLKNYISYWYYWTKDSYNNNDNYSVGAVEGNVSKGNKNTGDGRIICIK